MTGYIYSLSLDKKIFYIGSSFDAKTRLLSHKTKFGYNTEMEIIEEVNVKQRWDLQNIEMYWIEQFKQWGFNLKNKDVTKSYHKAPAAVVKYILEVKNERYTDTEMTMKLFTKIMWDLIIEHKNLTTHEKNS